MRKLLREFFGAPETDDQASDTTRVEKPEITLPDDFKSEAEFLQHMRKEFYADISYDRNNREAAVEDLRFMVGDQWDDWVRQRREAARKPVLTVHRLLAFVSQIVGARRLNETNIKVSADQGGTKNVARIREGILRNIQKESRADIAYDKALENTVICGIGNFALDLDYEADDVFEQKMEISARPDALSIVWDRMSREPTGRDAGHAFDLETFKQDDFYRRWPWATPADMVVDVTLRGDLRMNGWIALDDVRVVKYWRKRTRMRTLAMLTDGRVLDITDLTDEDHPAFDPQKAQEILSDIATRPDGSPIMREAKRPYMEMYYCSGLDILEGPYRLECSRVPIFRVPGWEITIGEWSHRFGLIRFLKDPQRLHNFFRSVFAEKLMQSPRAVWKAAASAVLGREKQWRDSGNSDDPLLIYNDETSKPPERVEPIPLEAALLQMAEMTTQDLKDVSNIHEANLGMPSNEVSGVAITARQRVSDTGTIIFHDNLTLAQEECGRVANELMGSVYDTARVVKVQGEDAKDMMTEINQVGKPETDITIGRYSVTVQTGPNYATKRIETQDFIQKLISALPQVGAVVADLLVEAFDVPVADEIARRIRLTLPPGILDTKDMSPEDQQRAASAQQAQQANLEMQQRLATANLMKIASEAALNSSRAQNYNTQTQMAPVKEATAAANAESQAADRQLRGHLEAIRVADGQG